MAGGASLVAVGNNALIVDADMPGIVDLINLTDQRIYNPTVFRLTTAEGYTCTIDQKLGVTAMSDLHGNTLAINSTGIIHSSGKSIVFTRDATAKKPATRCPSWSPSTTISRDQLRNIAASPIDGFSFEGKVRTIKKARSGMAIA